MRAIFMNWIFRAFRKNLRQSETYATRRRRIIDHYNYTFSYNEMKMENLLFEMGNNRITSIPPTRRNCQQQTDHDYYTLRLENANT